MKPGTKFSVGAHFGFLFLVSLIALPPLSSEWPGELSHVTVLPKKSDADRRVYFDRTQDFSTGTRPLDLPVWPLHLMLLLATGAFVGAGLAGNRRTCSQREPWED